MSTKLSVDPTNDFRNNSTIYGSSRILLGYIRSRTYSIEYYWSRYG